MLFYAFLIKLIIILPMALPPPSVLAGSYRILGIGNLVPASWYALGLQFNIISLCIEVFTPKFNSYDIALNFSSLLELKGLFFYCHCFMFAIIYKLFMHFSVGLRFELWISYLQSRCSTAWNTVNFALGYSGVGGLWNYLPGLAWNHNPPDLSLPSS
jgi:hypothetical protein